MIYEVTELFSGCITYDSSQSTPLNSKNHCYLVSSRSFEGKSTSNDSSPCWFICFSTIIRGFLKSQIGQFWRLEKPSTSKWIATLNIYFLKTHHQLRCSPPGVAFIWGFINYWMSNKKCYCELMRCSYEAIGRNLDLWENNSWILHRNLASSIIFTGLGSLRLFLKLKTPMKERSPHMRSASKIRKTTNFYLRVIFSRGQSIVQEEINNFWKKYKVF